MGASLTMIDRHYGHLARDGREHAIWLLDSYADILMWWCQGLSAPSPALTGELGSFPVSD